MAKIPARIVKRKKIDFNGEILQCLNLPVKIGTHYFSPPVLGTFILLELIDSQFVKDYKKSSYLDFCRAAYIAAKGRAALDIVADWTRQDGAKTVIADNLKTWLDLEHRSAEFARLNRFDIQDTFKLYRLLMENTFNGYSMIPDGGGLSYQPYIFGAETIASTIRIAGAAGISTDAAIWQTPLILIGHMIASLARYNGIKGIERPEDSEDVKKLLKEARERIKKGELHPWQKEDPYNYPLEDEQIQEHPELQKEYDKTLAEYLAKKR